MRMLEDQRLESVGPVSLIAAIASAELAARALANWPDSSSLWYVNLELLRSFRHMPAGFGLQWLNSGEFARPTCIVFVLVALLCLGPITRSRLPLAIASNFSLIYSGCLLFGAFAADQSAATSGISLAALWSPSSALAVAVLLASILSSTISHRSYWREIFP
jgi:hypothetical protein